MSEHQTERYLRERSAIIEIIHSLLAVSEISKSLNAVTDNCTEVIEPAETGIIFLWDETTRMLRPYAATGYDLGVFQEVNLQLGESLPGKVFAIGKPCLYTSTEKITQAMGDLRSVNLDLWQRSLGREYQPKGILAAQIKSKNQNLGVMVFETLDGSMDFTKQDLSFIQLIADLVSLSLERYRSNIKINASQMGGQMRTGWAETLSHELSMPLTAIKGYATALLLEEVEWSLAKRQEFLQLIEAECGQMEKLLSDLLDATLIDFNQFSLDLKPLNLSQVARQTTMEMEHRTDLHHLIVDFPKNFPLIRADPRWIKQVFRNLIDNAIKYSPKGGLIVIHGEVRSSDVRISISDQGFGIPPEDLIPIFDKYVRAKSPAGESIPGTGLGLPIARTIIEAHDGFIWAESRINQGTIISFSLPYEKLS